MTTKSSGQDGRPGPADSAADEVFSNADGATWQTQSLEDRPLSEVLEELRALMRPPLEYPPDLDPKACDFIDAVNEHRIIAGHPETLALLRGLPEDIALWPVPLAERGVLMTGAMIAEDRAKRGAR